MGKRVDEKILDFINVIEGEFYIKVNNVIMNGSIREAYAPW